MGARRRGLHNNIFNEETVAACAELPPEGRKLKVVRTIVYSAMIGLVLAVGWLLLHARTDVFLQSIWIFTQGTGLSYIFVQPVRPHAREK